MIKLSLVILAAGIGSRFGGVKQLERVGPNGEIIMDYAVRDAVAAGFERIVFLIRRDIDRDFRAVIGDRIEVWCAERGVEVVYAYQEKTDLPEGFTCPEDRARPWGTGQAVLACRGTIDGPFAVCNADDYYGRQAFRDIACHLRAGNGWCLAGFQLKNTLSCFGGVTRGICRVDGAGKLLSVTETRGVCVEDLGTRLDPETCVSMNMWGFGPEFLELLAEKFVLFLEKHGKEKDCEFLLPEIVDELLREGRATVQVLPTADRWYGMTYREDIPIVKEALSKL